MSLHYVLAVENWEGDVIKKYIMIAFLYIVVGTKTEHNKCWIRVKLFTMDGQFGFHELQ